MKKIIVLSFAVMCSLFFLGQMSSYQTHAQTASEKPSIIVRRSEGVIRGNALNRVAPEYPTQAKEQKIEGDVVVEITIDEEGNVSSAKSLSGQEILVPATLEAAKKWTFKPVTLNNQPIKVTGLLTFRFKLESPFISNTATDIRTDGTLPPNSIIRRSENVLRGNVISKVAPEYPTEAKEQKVEGDVVVEITIGEDGTVINSRAISGHKLLVKAAEDAAKEWTFKTTSLDGNPVKVAGVITFRFSLSENDEKIFNKSEGQIRKSAIYTEFPKYPKEAVDKKIGGDVEVEVLIDEKGAVLSAKAISGPTELIKAAEEAAIKWVFNAFKVGEKPVKVKGTLSFRFMPGSLADHLNQNN